MLTKPFHLTAYCPLNCSDTMYICTPGNMAYCDSCNRRFKTEHDLRKHERDSPQHWACEPCRRDFETEWGRIQHYVQSPRHSYCQDCDELFDGDEDLLAHNDDVHWHCADCNKVLFR